MSTIDELLSTVNPKDKNLLYLASGVKTRRCYTSLGFDNVFLVDRLIEKSERKGCVVSVGTECLDFVLECVRRNITFDAVVIINEGLWEGGGKYPLHADWFLGLLIATVKDQYVHVACPEYYRHEHLCIRENFLDVPFCKTELHQGDADYLDPHSFCEWDDHARSSKVWSMQRTTRCHQFQLGSVHCSVRQQSVWENRDDYDLIVVPAPFGPKDVMEVPLPMTRAAIKTMRAEWTPRRLFTDFDNAEELLTHCGDEINRVALLPWALGRYDATLEAISRYSHGPLQIDFYHLNQSDYATFYGIE